MSATRRVYPKADIANESTYRNTGSDGAAHANRQELQADLVCGVHPPETFARDVTEVGALIAAISLAGVTFTGGHTSNSLLGVYHMAQLDRVEFLGNDAVEVDERQGHPM